MPSQSSLCHTGRERKRNPLEGLRDPHLQNEVNTPALPALDPPERDREYHTFEDGRIAKLSAAVKSLKSGRARGPPGVSTPFQPYRLMKVQCYLAACREPAPSVWRSCDLNPGPPTVGTPRAQAQEPRRPPRSGPRRLARPACLPRPAPRAWQRSPPPPPPPAPRADAPRPAPRADAPRPAPVPAACSCAASPVVPPPPPAPLCCPLTCARRCLEVWKAARPSRRPGARMSPRTATRPAGPPPSPAAPARSPSSR